MNNVRASIQVHHSKRLVSFPITTGTYAGFLSRVIALVREKKSAMISVANVHMFIEAYKSPSYSEVIKGSEMIAPNGMPLVWALKVLNGIKQERIASMDLLPDLLARMTLEQISVYFYGGTRSMLQKTISYLSLKYPLLKIAGSFSPPFGKNYRLHDDALIEDINRSNPVIVFVILGCPKQELWMSSMIN